MIKLHLGCGTVYKDGWVNIDNNSDHNIQKLDLDWDLRQPLPFPDNSVDFIFNEHFLEHLTVEEGQKSIKDFMRVLKPNGVMRIAMPDLANTVKAYYDENWEENSREFRRKFGLSFIKTRAEAINIGFRWWGHKWLYDFEELDRRLREAGCVNIKRGNLRESEHQELRGLETRNESTLIAEVVKACRNEVTGIDFERNNQAALCCNDKVSQIVNVNEFGDTDFAGEEGSISLKRDINKKTGDFWSSRPKENYPIAWWHHPSIIRNINKLVCGLPIEGFSAGLHEKLKEMQRTFQEGISVGCGNGYKEFALMKAGIVNNFTLFELAEKSLSDAKILAKELGVFDNVEFILGDCYQHKFSKKIDFVHWNNSLHHMHDASKAVCWSRDLLKKGGVFYMDDYVGPSRFQFSDKDLLLMSYIRSILPDKYLIDRNNQGRLISRRVGRPAVKDMINSDPSEAADSANIIASVKKYFPNADITLTGGAIYHTALFGILANFDEKNEADVNILNALCLLDKMWLDYGVESQYATALAVKE